MSFGLIGYGYEKSEEFKKELQLTKDGYNFLNNDSKKKIIKWCLNVINKEKGKNYDYEELLDNLIPIVKLDKLSYDFSDYYGDEKKQMEFLQTLQYLISRRIVSENLEPTKIKETNENLIADIKIVNRGYRILNDEGKRKLIEWCLKTLESYHIKINNEQFVDVFVEEVDFEALANIYSKDEEKQIHFLQNLACIMQELISLNLVDENYGQKQYAKNEKRR